MTRESDLNPSCVIAAVSTKFTILSSLSSSSSSLLSSSHLSVWCGLYHIVIWDEQEFMLCAKTRQAYQILCDIQTTKIDGSTTLTSAPRRAATNSCRPAKNYSRKDELGRLNQNNNDRIEAATFQVSEYKQRDRTGDDDDEESINHNKVSAGDITAFSEIRLKTSSGSGNEKKTH